MAHRASSHKCGYSRESRTRRIDVLLGAQASIVARSRGTPSRTQSLKGPPFLKAR